MNTRRGTLLLPLLLVAAAARGAEPATDAVEAPAAEAAIREAVAAYVDAFNRRDAAALAALWSPDGVYISRSTGDAVSGREALLEEFSAILGSDDAPTLAASTDSVDFVSPSVAVERGTAVIQSPGGTSSATTYHAVYVRRDGAWLVDRITEEEAPAFESAAGRLAALEWLVGDWAHESDGSAIAFSTAWTKNRTFLSRSYTVTADGAVESSGLQVIGWDARDEQVVSWLFDSDGGVVTGVWTQRDDRWVVLSTARLADGGRGSYTSVIRPLGDDEFAWRKVNQVIDGAMLPNLDEVVFRRR